MKNYKLLALTLLTCSTITAHAVEPPNVACAKQNVIHYYTSGEYDKDVDKIVKRAEDYLYKRISENNAAVNPKKLAIVLDIDDTSLTNFIVNKVDDFSNNEDLIEKRYEKANSPAIKPVLRLYNEAVANGVSVFFITFRPQHVEGYTIKNLQEAGYQHWSGLYFPTDDQIKQGSKIYKTTLRNALEQQGYQIILNLGDQPSDLDGEDHVEQKVKIPNPMYTSPASCIINKSCV